MMADSAKVYATMFFSLMLKLYGAYCIPLQICIAFTKSRSKWSIKGVQSGSPVAQIPLYPYRGGLKYVSQVL